MSEPEIVDGRDRTPEPWPLHERVVKTLRGSTPFGLLLAWAFVFPILVLLMSSFEYANRSPEICTGLGFGCQPGPLLTTVLAFFYGVVPGVIAFSLLLLVMTIFKASLRVRLWVAGVGPPLGFVLIALLI